MPTWNTLKYFFTHAPQKDFDHVVAILRNNLMQSIGDEVQVDGIIEILQAYRDDNLSLTPEGIKVFFKVQTAALIRFFKRDIPNIIFWVVLTLILSFGSGICFLWSFFIDIHRATGKHPSGYLYLLAPLAGFATRLVDISLRFVLKFLFVFPPPPQQVNNAAQEPPPEVNPAAPEE